MSALNVLTPLVVGLSLSVAGLNVVSAVKVVKEPPIIEGSAVYGQPVRAGESVTIPWEIRKTTNCPGVLARVWSGEDNFQLSEQTRPAALPASETFRRYNIQTEIPDLAPPGKLTLTITGTYRCSGSPKRRFTLGPVALTVVP